MTAASSAAARRALIRYLGTAILARTASGGAGVALISLALDPGAHQRHGAAVGGLLTALLTAPYLFGPWLGGLLDHAADGRRVLAAAFVTYAVALGAGSAMLGHGPLLMAALLIFAAGFGGPLLTGGLSSRLGALTGDDARSQRRAEGWDTVSYGLGSTAGPAAVAVTASLTTPFTAVLLLAAAAGVAALAVLTLPAGGRDLPTSQADGEPPETLTGLATLRLLATNGPLRRVTIATSLTALSTGAIYLIAAVLGHQLLPRPGAGSILAAAVGLGNLAASLAITAYPLRGDPEVLVRRCAAIVGVAMASCALVPDFGWAVVTFALVGAATAPLFAASLAARSRYSPPAARAQIFVTMASVKMATATAGAALAGVTIDAGPRLLLDVGAALAIGTAFAVGLDKLATADRGRRRAAATSQGTGSCVSATLAGASGIPTPVPDGRNATGPV